jgi:hypothetical protein
MESRNALLDFTLKTETSFYIIWNEYLTEITRIFMLECFGRIIDRLLLYIYSINCAVNSWN